MALRIGVDYNTFWKLTPKILDKFIQAYKLRLEDQNNMAWRQGFYNYVAYQSILPSILSLGKKPPLEYLKEPIKLFEDEDNTKIDEEKEKEKQRMQLFLYLKSIEERCK